MGGYDIAGRGIWTCTVSFCLYFWQLICRGLQGPSTGADTRATHHHCTPPPLLLHFTTKNAITLCRHARHVRIHAHSFSTYAHALCARRLHAAHHTHMSPHHSSVAPLPLIYGVLLPTLLYRFPTHCSYHCYYHCTLPSHRNHRCNVTGDGDRAGPLLLQPVRGNHAA